MLGRELEMKRGRGPRRRRGRWSVFNRLIVLIACVILVIVLLSHAGSFLVLNAPEHSDVILVLAGQPMDHGIGTPLNCGIEGMQTKSYWMRASPRRCTESPKPTWLVTF